MEKEVQKQETKNIISKEIQQRELKLLDKQLEQHKDVFLRLKDK